MGSPKQYSIIKLISAFLVTLFVITLFFATAAYIAYARSAYSSSLDNYQRISYDDARAISSNIFSAKKQFESLVAEAEQSSLWWEEDIYVQAQSYHALDVAASNSLRVCDVAGGIVIFPRYSEIVIAAHHMSNGAFYAFLDKYNHHNSILPASPLWGEAEELYWVLSESIITRNYNTAATQTAAIAYMTLPMEELLSSGFSDLQQMLCYISGSNVTVCADTIRSDTLRSVNATSLEELLLAKVQQLSLDGYVAISSPLEDTGLYLVSFIPKSSLLSPFWVIVVLGGILIAVLLLVTFFGITYISNRIHTPINCLIHDVQNISAHDGYRLGESSSVEISNISHSINQLLDELQEKNDLVLGAQKQMLELDMLYKESQLLALQAQINPHFLYNTLECIRSLAQQGGQEQLVDILEPMIFIYRYSASSHPMGTIASECDCVRAYGKIIEVRFAGRIRIQVEMDDAVRQVAIPRMVLQPIVENAVNHAYADTLDSAVVTVTARTEGGSVVLRVCDHGCGMTEAQLSALTARITAQHIGENERRHIGLRNVHQRIQREFGGHCGLKIESKQGYYTNVSIAIPNYSEEGKL